MKYYILEEPPENPYNKDNPKADGIPAIFILFGIIIILGVLGKVWEIVEKIIKEKKTK